MLNSSTGQRHCGSGQLFPVIIILQVMKRIQAVPCRFTNPDAEHVVHETIAQYRTPLVASFAPYCPAHERVRLQHGDELGTHELVPLISSLRAADCSVERERGLRVVVYLLDA